MIALTGKAVDAAVECIVECLEQGNKVLVFGCGGQAANAMHFEAELAGKFEEFEDPLPCICLGLNPCYMTAVTNDFGWEYAFSRQIKALACPGDVVVGFTVSGNADYYREAAEETIRQSSCFINIAGADGWVAPYAGSVTVKTTGIITPGVQEEQLSIVHYICGEVKRRRAR